MSSQAPSTVDSASYQQSLSQIITDKVEPNAAQVDQSGTFPRAAVDALTTAGLLGLTVPAEFGGGGRASAPPPTSSGSCR